MEKTGGAFQGPPPLPIQLRRRSNFTVGTLTATVQPVDTVGRGRRDHTGHRRKNIKLINFCNQPHLIFWNHTVQ